MLKYVVCKYFKLTTIDDNNKEKKHLDFGQIKTHFPTAKIVFSEWWHKLAWSPGSGDTGDVTVTGVTLNHGKIPDGEGYLLSFNYHGNRPGR